MDLANSYISNPKKLHKHHNQPGTSKVDDWKGRSFEAPLENLHLLKDCWVGILKDPTVFDSMHDLYSMKDNQQVSLKYMGDNLVLILGLCKEQVHNLCTAKEENFLSIFKSIQSWNNSIVSTSRLVWLKCYGVPISQ